MLTEVKKRRVEQEPGGDRKQDGGVAAAASNGGLHELQERQAAPASGGNDLRIMVAKLKRKAEAQHQKQRAQALGRDLKKPRM